MSHLHQLTDIERACDELEHILSAALARLDQRDATQVEETTMGYCYETSLSTGQLPTSGDTAVIHMLPPAIPQGNRNASADKSPVSPLTSHRQPGGQLGMETPQELRSA